MALIIQSDRVQDGTASWVSVIILSLPLPCPSNGETIGQICHTTREQVYVFASKSVGGSSPFCVVLCISVCPNCESSLILTPYLLASTALASAPGSVGQIALPPASVEAHAVRLYPSTLPSRAP